MTKIKPVRAWALLIGGRINPYQIFAYKDKALPKYGWA